MTFQNGTAIPTNVIQMVTQFTAAQAAADVQSTALNIPPATLPTTYGVLGSNGSPSGSLASGLYGQNSNPPGRLSDQTPIGLIVLANQQWLISNYQYRV